MKTIINNLPTSLNELHGIIANLQQSLQETKQELTNEKLKNAYLLEQFRLARQERFAPRTEKNIHQADLFDEAGIESDEIDENSSIEVKGHQRKKTSR